MNKHSSPSTMQSQQGYSLIEVMLTVVILSIGLAGLGLLQVNNVQNTYNANNRAAAATAASDMADRIRANLVAYENGLFTDVTQGLTTAALLVAVVPCAILPRWRRMI